MRLPAVSARSPLSGLRVALLALLLCGASAAAAGGEGGAAEQAAPIGPLLLALVVILVGAKLGGELFERLGQPAVLGEILVGILLGNAPLVGVGSLAFIPRLETVQSLAELGVILLLFEVGLESNMGEMRRVGLSSLLVATLGVIAPAALGIGVGRIFLPTEPFLAHLFLGATLCATSVGITARVLRDLGHLQRTESRIVLGAAVIDDVMGLAVLAVVSALISGGAGSSGIGPIAAIGLKALGFLAGALILGRWLAPLLFRVASFLAVQHMLLVTSLGFCFVLAWLAAALQLAPIVGAFAAGLVLDPVHYRDFRDRGEHTIEEQVRPLGGFLIPVFFVVTGMKVDLRALGDPGVLGFAAALTAAAVVGKQVCGLGVLEKGLDRLSVGLGMIPRGEVGLIFANIGLGLRLPGPGGVPEPVVSPGTFSALVLVVMVTTLVTPPLLKWSFGRGPTTGSAGPADSI